jgi:NADPH2:quinone reductase
MRTTTVVATAYGGPEVLALIESELGEPGEGEVLIDVRAAGTNPVDYKLYGGTYGDDPNNLPMHLGFEAAGVVRSVGGDAVGPSGPIHPGDEVVAFRVNGAYASALIVAAKEVLAKPSTMSFEEASGLMLTGATAVHALHATHVTNGDTVVIHGGAGGVGLMAVQLAVADGARVIATAGESAHELLRSLGAEPVLYGEGLLERIQAIAPAGVDAAVDFIGTDEATDVSIALVTNRERIATIVASARAREMGIQALGGGPGADPGTELRNAARLELIRRAEAGVLKVIVAGAFALTDVAAAHRELASGHTHGKIVLIP